MATRKRSKWVLTSGVLVLLAGFLIFAFWPRAITVDLGTVERGDLVVTINEEGRTRVHDSYVVSTPVLGRLLRVGVEPGDEVERGETVVARMLPTNPSVLDVRTREQARAAVTAAEAALRVARADLNKAVADLSLAKSDFERVETLVQSGRVSQATLDRAERETRSAEAVVDRAEAAISVRSAELANANAQLIGFDNEGFASALSVEGDEIPLYAPASGRVLQVIQQNETTLPAGSPILEIGDIDGDLEVIVELLSTDAVKVAEGDRVIIDNWGGDVPLNGHIDRVDPLGFTKFSALGVEEQRVNAVISLDQTDGVPGNLGHGYRVEARIVVLEEFDALLIPASALFRVADTWAVFAVVGGRLEERSVQLSANNGVMASVAEGVSEAETIVLYPSVGLKAGLRVVAR